MSTIIVACHTIEDELNLAIRATGITYPVYWVDSQLHIKPEKLREHVQGILARMSNVSTILLAFGSCGTGLVGIKSEAARLILPKVEDCISLLLGSEERRRNHSRETASYYLTRGWMESEKSIADEYEYCVRKFGSERGARLARTMLKHYRCLTLIDTAAYDIGPYRVRTEELAAKLALTPQIIKGSQRLFEKLLLGPWDEEFVIAKPGQEITLDGFLGWSPQTGSSQV